MGRWLVLVYTWSWTLGVNPFMETATRMKITHYTRKDVPLVPVPPWGLRHRGRDSGDSSEVDLRERMELSTRQVPLTGRRLLRTSVRILSGHLIQVPLVPRGTTSTDRRTFSLYLFYGTYTENGSCHRNRTSHVISTTISSQKWFSPIHDVRPIERVPDPRVIPCREPQITRCQW